MASSEPTGAAVSPPSPSTPLPLLHRTASALSAVGDVEAVVDVVRRAAHEGLRSLTCRVLLVDETSPTTLLDPVDRTLPPVPLEDPSPLARVMTTGELLFAPEGTDGGVVGVEGVDGVDVGREPALLADPGERSRAWLPLIVQNRTIGVLRLGFATAAVLAPAERSLAIGLALQCGLAVERAQVLRAAARAERRFRTLAAADALDVFTTLGDPEAATTPGLPALTSDLPGWQRLTGRAEPLGPRDWLADIHPDDLPIVQDSWSFGRATGGRITCRFRVRGAKGWRWLSCVAVPVRDVGTLGNGGSGGTDPESPVLEWVGSFSDITETVRSRRRNRALQRLAVAMAEAETVDDAVQGIIAAAVAGSGARRGLLVIHTPTTDRLVARSDDPQLLAALRESRIGVHEHAQLVDALARRGGLELTATSGPADLEVVPEVLRAQFTRAAEQGEVAWRLLPLELRGLPLGSLTLGYSRLEAEEEDEGSAEHLDALRRQIAAGLDRLLLLEAERSTASILQEALQPGPLPLIRWLHAVRATATSAGTEVGGDWAELIALDDDLTAVVLGDVMGRGAHAATVMGEVRTMVRTLAVVDPHPSAVLRGLDACFAATGTDDLVTLFYGLLSADGRLLAASAGHLPPLAVGDQVRYLDVPPGVPLGVAGDLRDEVLHDHLAPDAGLVVFSDGLVETRSRSLTDGLEIVRELVAGHPGAATDELVALLLTEMAAGVEVDDDVTVLALRYVPRPD